MKLSEKIIVSRKKQGLSQVDLADTLGVSRQSVSKWETEESKPDINKLPALAKALDVSIDWLLSEEEIEEDKEKSPCENTYMNEETVVKAYPDWVDKAPSFMGNAIKKYGWIYGVRFIVAGALFTLFGIVAIVVFYNFNFGGNKASNTYSNTYSTINDIVGNQAFGENVFVSPDVWSVGENVDFGSNFFSDINNKAWSVFSAIAGLMIGIGIITLIGGIILTVILNRWSKTVDKS